MLLPFVGCTTVYKVDEKGVCRAPSGQVVNIEDIEPCCFDRSSESVGDPSTYTKSTMTDMKYWLRTQGGSTAYGW